MCPSVPGMAPRSANRIQMRPTFTLAHLLLIITLTSRHHLWTAVVLLFIWASLFHLLLWEVDSSQVQYVMNHVSLPRSEGFPETQAKRDG